MAGPETGVCYYPEQWDSTLWRDDAAAMVAMGLSWVRIGEFTWARIESSRGVFDWAWLDAAVEVLGAAGLKVMMCTPTAAPPKWLVDEHPEILPVDADDQVRKFGARRHYCFSSDFYRAEAQRISGEFARRYGSNPQVRAWQVDNEYNDHDTTLSYSDAARDGFRLWLADKYRDIATLNTAWGTAFWGMRYNSFAAVDLPNQCVEQPDPTHAMDFARYSSDQVLRFNLAQVAAVREHARGVPVTHNFMAGSYEFDHHELADSLDFVAWDSYPLGNLLSGPETPKEKDRWLRTGAPDYQGFHCDLYRGQGKGRVWVTEQQPGPVNWAAHNPAPADGMVRLWTWLAWAHGVDVVCYFRWRQAPSAQEQFHTGLHLPDGTPDQAAHEIAQVADERARLPHPGPRGAAKVAMVLDYPSRWAQAILPQGQGYSGDHIARNWYRACRSLGVDVDVIGPENDLSGYALVLVPDMMIADETFAKTLKQSRIKALFGPRTGSKTAAMHSPQTLPPGPFQALIDLRVTRVESVPDWHLEPIRFEGQDFTSTGWRESIETTAGVIATFTGPYRTNAPCVVRNERCCYVATLPTGAFLSALIQSCLDWAGVATAPTGDDLRITRRGALWFAFNFGPETLSLPENPTASFLIGGPTVAPADLAVWTCDDNA